MLVEEEESKDELLDRFGRLRMLMGSFQWDLSSMDQIKVDQESLDCRIATAAARRRPARAGKRIKYLGIPPGFQIQ